MVEIESISSLLGDKALPFLTDLLTVKGWLGRIKQKAFGVPKEEIPYMREKRFNSQEFIVHFLFGTILGTPMGFGIWTASVIGELLRGGNFFNSYPAAYLFIGGSAFLCGLFFVLYKGPRW